MKTYRLDFPLDLSIHLVPVEDGKDFLDEKGIKTYRGVIHSISENDKMILRQQVNEIFFEPLKEQRQKEADEFKELNEKVQLEREEELKEQEERAKEELGMQDSDSSEGEARGEESEKASSEGTESGPSKDDGETE